MVCQNEGKMFHLTVTWSTKKPLGTLKKQAKQVLSFSWMVKPMKEEVWVQQLCLCRDPGGHILSNISMVSLKCKQILSSPAKFMYLEIPLFCHHLLAHCLIVSSFIKTSHKP